MFSKLRKRYGALGPVVVLALIVAVAFAGVPAVAQPIATTSASLAKKVSKALGLAGKANKRSIRAIKIARNASGTPGPQGAQGLPGTPGANGKDGANGTNGSNGVSVTSEEFEGAEGPCEEGGSEFTSASPEPTYACNGSPWTAGGTLPSEKTETGSWGGTVGAFEIGIAPISFTLPLEASLPLSNVHYDTPETAECPGTAENPEAIPGHLCVYEQLATEVPIKLINKAAGEPEDKGASKSGAIVLLNGIPGGFVYGTWAVTAPAP